MADSIDSLRERVRSLRSDFEAAVREARDAPSVQALRDRFLGRKSGSVTALMKSLGNFAEDARRVDWIGDERRGEPFDGKSTDSKRPDQDQVVQQREAEPDDDRGALRLDGGAAGH